MSKGRGAGCDIRQLQSYLAQVHRGGLGVKYVGCASDTEERNTTLQELTRDMYQSLVAP